MYPNTIHLSDLMHELGAFVRVENAPSRNGYGKAPNQFIIRYEHGTIFQSYETLIGARINGHLYLTSAHDYSNTTSGHCGRWCGYNTKERRERLADGRITYIED